MKIRKYIITTVFFIIIYTTVLLGQFKIIENISTSMLYSMFDSFQKTRNRLSERIKDVCTTVTIISQLEQHPKIFEIENVVKKLARQEHIAKLFIVKDNKFQYLFINNKFMNNSFLDIRSLNINHIGSIERSISNVFLLINPTSQYLKYKFEYSNYIVYAYINFEDVSKISFFNSILSYNIYQKASSPINTYPINYTIIPHPERKLYINTWVLKFTYNYQLSENITLSTYIEYPIFGYQYSIYFILYIVIILILVLVDYYYLKYISIQKHREYLNKEIIVTKTKLQNFERDVYKNSLDSLNIGVIIFDNAFNIIYENSFISNKHIPISKETIINEEKIVIHDFTFYIQTFPLIISNVQQGLIAIFTDITQDLYYKESILKSKQDAEHNEQIFKSIFEMSPDAILITQQHTIQYINQAGLELCQYSSSDQIIGLPITLFLYNDDSNKIIERINQIYLHNEKITDPVVYRFINKSGSIIYGETKSSIIIFNDKPAILSIVRNVSKTYKEIQQLYLLDKAIQALPLGVTITNLSNEIIYTNVAEAHFHGYEDITELIGKSVRIFSPEDQWSTGNKLYGNTNSLKKIRESINIKKNGITFPVKLISEVIFENNTPIGIVTICEDITIKKKIDLELLRLKKAIDTVQVGITITNNEQLIVYTNLTEALLHGYSSPEDLIGKPSSIYAPKNFIGISNRNVPHDHVWKRESINITQDGKEFPVEIVSSDIYDHDTYVGRVSVCSDITERKQQELKLLTSEKQFKLLFEQSPIGLVEFDFSEMKTYLFYLKNVYNIVYFDQFFERNPQYYEEAIQKIRIVQINHACLSIFSSRYQDIKQMIINFIYTNKNEIQHDLHEFLYNESYIAHHQYHTKTATNQELYIDTYLAILAKNGGKWSSALLSIIDVTKKSQLEQEHLKLSYAIYNSANGIIITNTQGIITYCNPAFLKMNGYTYEEIINNNPRLLKSGKQNNEFYEQLWDTISNGRIWEGEIINKNKNGTYYTEYMTITPVIDHNNDIISYIAIKNDITQQKQQSVELTQQKEKYESLYQLMRRMTDNVVDLIWAKNLQKEYIFVNKAVCEKLLCAINTDEPIGKTDLYFAERERLLHPADNEWHTFGELCQDSDDVILETKQATQFDEFGNIRKQRLDLDVWKAPLLDDHDNMIGIVGSARIVTEHKKLEYEKTQALERVQQSESEIKNALYEAPFPIILYDVDGQIHIMSKYVEDTVNISLSTRKITVHDFADKCNLYSDIFSYEMSQHILNSHSQIHHGEFLIRTKNYEYRTWDIYSTSYGHSKIMFMAFDVTERKFHESQVIAKRNLLQSIIDLIPDPICVKDTELRYLIVNKAYVTYYNLSDFTQLLGKTDEMLSHMLLERNYDESSVIQYGEIILNKEEVLYKHDGTTQWALSSHIPIRDTHHVITGVLSYYKNIHDVKSLNDENEKLKEQYKFLAHQTAEFIEQMNKSYEQQRHFSITKSDR